MKKNNSPNTVTLNTAIASEDIGRRKRRPKSSQTSPQWKASFPLADFTAENLVVPPELEIPLSEIKRPADFPSFFLLGK